MVEQDRIALNERFQNVYKLLEERGEIVNNHSEKSKSAFAEKLLGSRQYGHIIGQFLSGKRCIAYKHARKLCNLYGINQDYMLHGIGEPFDDFVVSSPTRFAPDPTASNQILYTNTASLANHGIPTNSFAYEQAAFFSLPKLSARNLVAFDVEGHSMEPILSKGDIVVCEPVDDVNSLKDNEIYAIRLNGQVWVKHIQKVKDSRGRVSHLDLLSANYLEHPPFREEVKGVINFYKVIKKITSV